MSEATPRATRVPGMILLGPGLAAAAGVALAELSNLGTAASVAAAAISGVAAAVLLVAPRRPELPRTSSAEAGRSLGAVSRQQGGELVRIIADHVPDAVVFFSDFGVIRYANPVARELFFDGKPPEGQNFIRLVADAPLPLREALLGESERLFTMDVEGRRETYHVSRRSFMLEGELHTLLSVKHMTREIGRREVDVLKKVVRVISHEVNNSLAPVTSLVHSARLMAKSPEHADKLERAFATIEERTTHLRSFLDGYAVLARLPEPRPRPADLGALVRSLSSLYPKVRWPEPPARQGFFDVVQLEQVVINLVKNAVEAGSPESEVEVTIAVSEDGTTVLDVLDQGPGFGAEALKNALMPLYTTKASGSGMGLSLSQEIVEAHGGSIGLSNRPDGGGSVRIILPGRDMKEQAELARSRLTLTRG